VTIANPQGEREATPVAPVREGAGATGEGRPVTDYISLWQPWASLWVGGAKLIETRGWQTKFRGRLAVHAGKRIDVDACYREPFRRALARLGFDQPLDLPRGAVIGWVTITDCLEMGTVQEGECPFSINSFFGDPRLTDVERAFGDYRSGRFAWITNRHRLTLPTPLPMRGLQRIQKLPPDIAARLT